MIARPYVIACALILFGMFIAAAAIVLHLHDIHAPIFLIDTLILFTLPAIIAAFALMWLLVSAIVPRHPSQRPAPAAAGTVAVAYFAATATLFCFTAGKLLGMAWPGLNLVFVVLGGLLIVYGNVAGKLPPNHMLGFRSIWALADEEVWDKTQRFGGWVMVIAGFLLLNAALLFDLSTVNWIALVLTCGTSLSITIASRHFARQKRKARDEEWRRLAL